MFFKDIEQWSKKKLKVLNFVFSILHFIALVLIPIIITCVNYKLFTKNESEFKLTIVGVIVVVILGLYAYDKMKKAIDKLPQIKLSQQRFKFSIQMVLSMLPVLITLFALNLAKNDFDIAINVIKWCSISFGAAILIDGLFLKYISQEISIREKALESVEVEKRKKLV